MCIYTEAHPSPHGPTPPPPRGRGMGCQAHRRLPVIGLTTESSAGRSGPGGRGAREPLDGVRAARGGGAEDDGLAVDAGPEAAVGKAEERVHLRGCRGAGDAWVTQ